eukprot:TRINITY_DN22542_c0_g1_i1.p1 TRINITY_DN22542_c0_g1~~TRINITY_DN22542_c0_g1_i1.p1  ORF type:complete len:822 (-),score=211.21 TRINITY_DN22542_c0_g1_i1:171-2636(-)
MAAAAAPAADPPVPSPSPPSPVPPLSDSEDEADDSIVSLTGSCRCGCVKLTTPINRRTPWLICDCEHCRKAHAAAWVVFVPPLGEQAAVVEWQLKEGALRFGPATSCSGLEDFLGKPTAACAGKLSSEDSSTSTRISGIRRSFCDGCGAHISVEVLRPGAGSKTFVVAGLLDDASFPKAFVPRTRVLGGSPIRLPHAPCCPLPPQFQPKFTSLASTVKAPGPSQGECACGGCSFTVMAPLTELQHCHCGACRKTSGAAFQTWLPVRRSSFKWTDSRLLKKIRSSPWANREVCSRCGSALVLAYHSQRNQVWLAGGCFRDEDFPSSPPWLESKHTCVAEAPPWRPAATWPADGLDRVLDAWQGDRKASSLKLADVVAAGELKSSFRRQRAQARRAQGASAEQAWDDTGVHHALHRISNAGGRAGEADQAQDDCCRRFVALPEGAGELGSDSAAVTELCAFTGCSLEAAKRALIDANGDAETAALLLLQKASETPPSAAAASASRPPAASAAAGVDDATPLSALASASSASAASAASGGGGRGSASRPAGQTGRRAAQRQQPARPKAESRMRGKALSRPELVAEIFNALDVDGSGFLSCQAMKKLASHSGFEGDDADWQDEYQLLCRERGCQPEQGISLPKFRELMEDDSEEGCYCNDQELAKIYRTLLLDRATAAARRQPAASPAAAATTPGAGAADIASAVASMPTPQKRPLEAVAAKEAGDSSSTGASSHSGLSGAALAKAAVAMAVAEGAGAEELEPAAKRSSSAATSEVSAAPASASFREPGAVGQKPKLLPSFGSGVLLKGGSCTIALSESEDEDMH